MHLTDDPLDLVSKLYQREIWDSVTRVASGQSLASPLIVDLDPTTFCDLACPECISGKLLNDGRISRERLERLADEFVEAGVKGVILIGGGEPLVHPGTRRVLEKLGEAGIGIGVVTNGTLIDVNLEPLARYASWVRVSVDAGTPATYDRFRPSRSGKNMFPKVIANMRLLAARKRGRLGYSFLLMTRLSNGEVVETNFHDVYEAGVLAHDIGCDYFEVKAMFDMDHFIVSQPTELEDALGRQLEALEELADESFQVIHSSTSDALQTHANRVQHKDYATCKVAELRTLVTPKGVFICPYHRGRAAAKLGDIVEDSFRDMWSAANRAKVNPSTDCRFHCARHESNLHLEAIGRGEPLREVVESFDLFI